jgi:uncharacterized membrane protein YgcG
MKRKALAVAGVAALTTLTIGGAALAAAGNDDPARGLPGAVAVTGSPSPDDTPSPTDTASPDDSPSPDDSSSTTVPAQPGGDVVTSDLAVAAALAHTGGGTVTRVESEFEHGRAVWKVRIVKNGVRYDLHVDKQTGAITRFENKGAESGSGRDGKDGNSGSGKGGKSGHGGGDDKGGDD